MSHLDEAVQLYGRSLANYSHADVEEKHRRYKELHQRLYTNAELSQDALKRGNKFFNLGEYDKAEKEYDEAVKRNPGNARLYRTRAGCHLKRKPKNCADAINDCKTALKLDPNYAAAHTRMGEAHQALGHSLQAEESYKKALALDPTECEAAWALEKLQRYQAKRHQ